MIGVIKHNFFLVCYCILLCIITFTPIVKQSLPTIWTAALWGGYVIIFSNKLFKCRERYLLKIRNSWLLYLLICMIYYLTGISEGNIGSTMPDIMSLISLFIYCIIIINCDDSQLYSIFHIFCFVIAFNIADSIRICIMYPSEVTYQLLSDELDANGISGLNIGGTSFLSMSVFFLNIVLISFFRTQRIIEKIVFGLYGLIVIIFDVFISFKASVLILAILSIFLQYIAHHSRSIKKALALCFLLFIAFYIFKDFLIVSLVGLIGSDRIATRLLAFVNDGANGSTSSIDSRTSLWLLSIETWLQNPITFLFGIGNKMKIEGLSSFLTGIGNHSDFFDTLAKYGIVGFSVLISAFINLYKYLKGIAKENSNIVLSFFVIVLIFAVTKKMLYPEICFICFCLLPLCLRVYRTKSKY